MLQIVRDSAFDFNHLRTGRLATSKRQLQRDNSPDDAGFGKVSCLSQNNRFGYLRQSGVQYALYIDESCLRASEASL